MKGDRIDSWPSDQKSILERLFSYARNNNVINHDVIKSDITVLNTIGADCVDPLKVFSAEKIQKIIHTVINQKYCMCSWSLDQARNGSAALMD